MSGGLRSISDLPAFRCGTPDERQWLRLAIQASAWVEGTDTGERELKFRESGAVHQLCDKSFARGGDGPEVALWALLNVGLLDFPMRVFSGLLTRLIRSPYDRCARPEPFLREPSVSVFGGLLVRLADADPEKVLVWVVDMAEGNRLAGIERQPTEVIRGLLFAPRVDWSFRMKFWEMAAACERFPDRIFCDPCDPANGRIFSSYHYRAFGQFLEWAPEPAVCRFVAAMRDRVNRKVIREIDEESRRVRYRIVPATPEEIGEARRRIVESVESPSRRESVSAILFSSPPAEPKQDPSRAE